jgi:hypothetical protein
MILVIENSPENRKIYKTAKQQFVHQSRTSHNYLDEFGKAHGLKVIIRRWINQYPLVEALEFNTEADCAWFLLKYS